MKQNKQDRRQPRERGERALRPIEAEIEPRQRFALNMQVRYCGRPANVIEIVPAQGRPKTLNLDVQTLRPMESYVVQFEQGGKTKQAWPAQYELEA